MLVLVRPLPSLASLLFLPSERFVLSPSSYFHYFRKYGFKKRENFPFFFLFCLCVSVVSWRAGWACMLCMLCKGIIHSELLKTTGVGGTDFYAFFCFSPQFSELVGRWWKVHYIGWILWQDCFDHRCEWWHW
jgi:hypothetical protein